MPIYEYFCEDCQVEFEELVFGDPQNVPCPKCQGTHTTKLMSRVRRGRGGSGDSAGSAPSGGGGCAGCSGGSCSTCG